MASLSTTASERAAIDEFRRTVVEPSMTALIIVDFWAEWCGPCKQLSPVLERVAAAYAGRGVKLVKIDVDKNRTIAEAFRVQSIPTVYAIFQGQRVADLTPARTEAQLNSFLDQILAQLPLEAEAPADSGPLIEAGQAALAEGEVEEALRIFGALFSEAPDQAEIAAGYARALIAQGEIAEAEKVLDAVSPEEARNPLVAQARAALGLARIAPAGADLQALRAAVDRDPQSSGARFQLADALIARGDRDGAADQLLHIIRHDPQWEEGRARSRLLELFEAVGLTDPWVLAARRKLSAILFA